MNHPLSAAVEAAGMVNVLNHGSGSCVYSEGCHGVTQEHLERFAELVREHLLDRVRQALLDTSEEGDGDYADHLFERVLQGLGSNHAPQESTAGALLVRGVRALDPERAAFDEWFQAEQGKAYDGMYTFALAAWRAARPKRAAGVLPDPSFTYERRPAGCEPERVGAYTADQLQAYAAQEVAKAQAEHRALRIALRGMVDAADRIDLDRPTFGDCQVMRKARAALALVDG